MKREIYEAIKHRISVTHDEEYYAEYPETPRSAPLYKFDASGLNDDPEYDFIFDIVHAMNTTNIWNVAQRFYMILKSNHMCIDKRLLKK